MRHAALGYFNLGLIFRSFWVQTNEQLTRTINNRNQSSVELERYNQQPQIGYAM